MRKKGANLTTRLKSVFGLLAFLAAIYFGSSLCLKLTGTRQLHLGPPQGIARFGIAKDIVTLTLQRREEQRQHETKSAEPWNPEVDAVFTFVNGSDPTWRAAFNEAAGRQQRPPLDDIAFGNRYREWGELRYAMRSAFMHAPWLRRLHVVVASASQIPSWLDASHPRNSSRLPQPAV